MDNYELLKEELKKARINIKEQESLRYPTPHSLEEYAKKIINVIQKADINDETFKTLSYWVIYNLKNFESDITGELYHDYDKKNVRYLEKWRKEKNKIASIIIEFHSKLKTKEFNE